MLFGLLSSYCVVLPNLRVLVLRDVYFRFVVCSVMFPVRVMIVWYQAEELLIKLSYEVYRRRLPVVIYEKMLPAT